MMNSGKQNLYNSALVPIGASQVLRNAVGVEGCQIFREKALRMCKVQHILTTNLAAVVCVCVCAQNLTNFCPHAPISNPYVPKILFA